MQTNTKQSKQGKQGKTPNEVSEILNLQLGFILNEIRNQTTGNLKTYNFINKTEQTTHEIMLYSFK